MEAADVAAVERTMTALKFVEAYGDEEADVTRTDLRILLEKYRQKPKSKGETGSDATIAGNGAAPPAPVDNIAAGEPAKAFIDAPPKPSRVNKET